MDRRAQRAAETGQANIQHQLQARAQESAREQANLEAVRKGERRRAEEARAALNDDPTITAALVRIDAEEKARERRAAEAEQRRHTEARAELEQEMDRRSGVWMSHGGDPDSFPRADMQREILMERQRERTRQQQAGSVF